MSATGFDYFADYRSAQEAGHHPDCDGFRTAHRTEVVRDEHGLMRAVCEECGPLHVGSFGRGAEAFVRSFLSHAHEEPCDLRCREWR